MNESSKQPRQISLSHIPLVSRSFSFIDFNAVSTLQIILYICHDDHLHGCLLLFVVVHIVEVENLTIHHHFPCIDR